MNVSHSLRVIVRDDPGDVARLAADIIQDELAQRPALDLGVATGSSAEPVYRELVRRGARMDRCTAYALDEYIGLPGEHPESYREVLRRELGPLGITDDRLHVPEGGSADVIAAAERFEAALARIGGVDVQLLGIGGNGHIGFNEPRSEITTRTRVVALAPATRAANARFFPDVEHVPTHALTQGIATILSAARVVLVACGPAKARAVARALGGPIAVDCPASLLRLHPEVTVLLDAAAAREWTSTGRRHSPTAA